MNRENKVQYLQDRSRGLELIICRDSLISYPLHNHVSVYTLGLVWAGAIRLTAGGHAFTCGKNDFFVIPPYLPHSIMAEEPYSMLVICLDKNRLSRSSRPKDAAGAFIDRAKIQLERYPERKISVAEMAGSACTSKYHFIRSFKRAVGLTPHQFQIQNQVRKAQRLLHNTNSLTEVALAAGFYDQSHFIRHFEKYLGLTPGAYQNSCRFLT